MADKKIILQVEADTGKADKSLDNIKKTTKDTGDAAKSAAGEFRVMGVSLNSVNRFFIDESYENAYFIKVSLVGINPVSNTCTSHEQWNLFRYVNSTLTRVSAQTIISVGDVTLTLELDAVAGSPDYIRVRVTGRASETWYHNVKLDITEVKYA